MRISDLKFSQDDKLARITATVQWEDCDRPECNVYIETEKAFADDLTLNPHAFLVGCIIPAMHFGEKRILLDAEICPMLREGLITVMALMKEWSQGTYRPLNIEARTSSTAHSLSNHRRAGLFLSGGMDSLAALRVNKNNFPEKHPGSIKDCLLVHGFDIGGVIERGMKYHVFDRAKAALLEVANDANVTLIPVYTNIRHLCDERQLWLDKFFGAVLAAVGHAFASRLNLVYIASSYDIPNLAPCGSHPLLDSEYSSYDLRIIHRDLSLSRLEKLKIVAGWDVAFQNFRVCLANVPDRLNCGKCEKCIRTMTELVAIGALDKTKAFVENDVTPSQLSQFDITIRHRDPFYRAMMAPLQKRGRHDLVETIKKMLAGHVFWFF
ncbi:MAG: hypothetical protein H8D96_14150 [Desulfobacterales bacterium]|uniref:Uncharacterized protein n=1 Tax=Candidatus Desulfatibia vada TaxID=2841696 RepID=A0A8J6P687_9BACT|nr:hypothetical protein [Candidatus Desulfatibia vada]MBL6972425.1 hypothetical protein [Desulfobacterales bacterium]